ncbi:kelch domain-containing protein 9-like [Mya arenaria]|uniref:kelch domain-containing protein 9-like n=1 Tax=Mya arenaria TaxID=6604 RepID=UPI0022DFA8D7|nr:kelch domain-containing protein 9-like [Mya arenaria]
MAGDQGNSSLPLDWEILLPAGPALANHAGCIINNTFYIHGGITQHRSIFPSNKFFRLNLSTMIWNEVRVPGSPQLSHHACVPLDDRYMVLIGGWDGQKRGSSVFIFDTVDQNWLYPTDSGFAEGAGLSSHASTLLGSGDILVVGREGCLRTVEKHGNAYILTPDLDKMEFTYTKIADDSISRSGHTVNVVGNCVYILGGREDDFIESHKGFSSAEPIGELNSKFMNVLQPQYLPPLLRLPKGRRNHVSIVGKGCILTHGGETFDGRSRTAVGDMILMTVKPEVTFYNVGTSTVTRASHVCVNTGDRVIFHGGIGWKNVVYGDCYELKTQL